MNHQNHYIQLSPRNSVIIVSICFCNVSISNCFAAEETDFAQTDALVNQSIWRSLGTLVLNWTLGSVLYHSFYLELTCSLPTIQKYMQLVHIAQCIDSNLLKVRFDQWYVALIEGILPDEEA